VKEVNTDNGIQLETEFTSCFLIMAVLPNISEEKEKFQMINTYCECKSKGEQMRWGLAFKILQKFHHICGVSGF
jgi:hypothetical protein